MEPNGMASGIYSNVQPGMLGLEMSLHHPIPPQNPQSSHLLQNPHHQLMGFGHHHDQNEYNPQTHQSAKQAHNPSSAKSKNQTLTLSDDDEPAENSAEDGRKKVVSPWQRMKWTDNMVRLLIMVVYYIGDEVVVSEGSDKKKGGGGGGGGVGVLQKKGKWKSVSRAMMERGFYVSPQQCEDKFNDLNKRYKRVNDILGKGVSCKVVENQSLLDKMDHLSPKMKDEVRKLLNSKHLFFREMCAYHSSCGHGGGGGEPAEVVAEPPQAVVVAQPGKCLHSTQSNVPNLNIVENVGTKVSKVVSCGEDDDDDDDDHDHDDEDDDHDVVSRKRLKKGATFSSSMFQQLDVELTNVLQDVTKSSGEKRDWMKTKLVRLDEQRVGIQSQSFEIEKQRLKWLKFSSKKEREMEKERLMNEKMKLENERMVLIIRQKELDLLDLHQYHHHQQYSSNRKSDPSSVTG